MKMVSNWILRNASKLNKITKCHASTSRKLNLWTRDNIVQSPYKDVEVPNSLVVNHIWNNVEKWADKTAVVCGITNRSYSYYKLYKRSRNFAANLRTKLKIKDGDVICIMMPNNPEYVVTVLGALEAGAAITTINPIFTNYEVQRHIELTNPKILIGVPDTIDILKAGLKLANKEANIITVKAPRENLPSDTIAFDHVCNDENVDYRVLNEVKRNADDVVFLPYSSGTTGLPKGVQLTNRNIAVNLVQTSAEGVKQYTDTTASNQDSTMAVLPFYHIYGLSVIMMHKLSAGLKLVTLPKFNPSTFVSTLVNHKISLLYSAPPLILYLANNPEVNKETLKSIRTVVCAAAPMPKADAEKTLEKLRSDGNYIQMYGLTETSPIATAATMGDKNYDYTSVGVPVPNTELKVVNPESQALGPNEIGELWIKGPQVMKGYKDNIEATRNALTEDGWFKSGDLASIDSKGNVTILDRIKELIKVKGFQVAPAELEGVLKEHPSILDAAVIGVPHEKMGEIPKAFVVIKKNKNLIAEEVKEFVKSRVASYKSLGDVKFVDNLPKNPSGKLLRKDLKEKYC